MDRARATYEAECAENSTKTDKRLFDDLHFHDLRHGNPPFFNGHEKWSQATRANFCIGVMPPRPMFGRS